MYSPTDPEILACEERLTEATRAVDVDALERLYAGAMIFTGVTGAICDKAAIMAEAKRGRAEREKASASAGAAAVVDYQKDELRVVRHGESAVTSYRFSVTIRGDGKEVVRRYRTTNVWAKRASQWQVVAAHTSALG